MSSVFGAPVALSEELGQGSKQLTLTYAVSRSGTLAYVPADLASGGRLVWRDRRGRELDSITEPGLYLNPELSPDGERLTVSRIDPDSGARDIWLIDLARNVSSRLTFDRAFENSAVWAPSGNRIAFNSNRTGVFNMYERSATSAASATRLLESDTDHAPLDWSSDGRHLVYLAFRDGKRDVHVLPLSGSGEPFEFLSSEYEEYQAQLSPDDRWLAYVSNESGTNEVFLRGGPSTTCHRTASGS
jgi:Tol biopolymer transport system component